LPPPLPKASTHCQILETGIERRLLSLDIIGIQPRRQVAGGPAAFDRKSCPHAYGLHAVAGQGVASLLIQSGA
jgi:hypothetical protein